MLEEGPSTCERCGGELRRVIHPAGIIFKGSGFYRTDARKADGAKPPASGNGSATDSKGASTTTTAPAPADASSDSGGSKS